MAQFQTQKSNLRGAGAVLSNHLGKAEHKVANEQMENYYFGIKDANVKVIKKQTDNVILNQTNFLLPWTPFKG